MRRFLMLIVALSFLTASAAGRAQQKALEKMTQQEIDEADIYAVTREATKEAKQINSDVLVTLQIKQAMARLMWPVNLSLLKAPAQDDEFRKLILALERQVGFKADGVLTTREFKQLQAAARNIYPVKVYLPPSLYAGRVGSDFVHAEGSWIIESDQVAFPLNHSTISCRRERKECELINVQVIAPGQLAFDEDYQVNVDSDFYAITNWDANVVTASKSAPCRSITLTINVSSKQITELATDNDPSGCEILPGQKKMPAMVKPRLSRLISGFDASKQYFEQLNKAAQKFLYLPAQRLLGVTN